MVQAFSSSRLCTVHGIRLPSCYLIGMVTGYSSVFILSVDHSSSLLPHRSRLELSYETSVAFSNKGLLKNMVQRHAFSNDDMSEPSK